VVAADEGDEGEATATAAAIVRAAIDKIVYSMDGDRQGDEPDGNSRPIRILM
jgi:hypothetical protein